MFTTIITAQEVAEGWCAFIRKQKAGTTKQIHGYAEFQHSLELLTALTALAFDEQAAGIFRDLRKALPQAGTQELKIASIGPRARCNASHAQRGGFQEGRPPSRGKLAGVSGEIISLAFPLSFLMGKNTQERQEFIIGNLRVEKDLIEV